LSQSMKFAFRATAVAAIAMVSASAFAAADFDANIELDSKVENLARGASQSGRVELNASKKMGSKYFIAGRATYLAKPDGSAGTDDVWAQMGSDTADIKLGRFEAANLFQTPGDVIVEYAGNAPYQANVLRGRQGGNSYGSVFHAAGTLQLGGGLSFELSGVSSKGKDAATGNVVPNGIRPVLNYANGPLHVAAGLEGIQYHSGLAKRVTGFGLTGDYNFGDVVLTGNFASAKNDMDYKQNTFAVMVGFGGLTLATVQGNTKTAGDDYKVSTFWAAYAIPFFDVKGATITPAVSFSKGSGSNTSKDSSGFALRVHYDF
jgi:hypothetical protein